ncbi:conserved hypothetical protein [Histoplasma capsulatum H143]|uniref:Aminoglycoside phosphotransferase domain-containing protein n=1 Tax=Ajellomyces capsulatus (strain H143) TaxID=544712 RepID=C6HH00_AJECH|nr:conserved hypothetical protein [Histoplasma capsulatum H143]
MESRDRRLTSQIPLDAEVLHELSPALLNISSLSSNGLEHSTTRSLSATIQRLNQAIVQSDVVWQLGSTVILGLSSKIVMKSGFGLDIEHISTMNYIKDRVPQLRAPDIHGVLQAGQRCFVFMTRVEGEPLDRVWKSLNRSQKDSIKEQLESMFFGIRSIPAPPSSSADAILGGGALRRCKDARREIRVAERSIANEAEFNQFLTTDPRRTETGWVKMIRSFLLSDHKMVMTHGDLHPRNIMISMKYKAPLSKPVTDWVKVTGVIDWEMCGYYPSYWEYVKALHTVGPKSIAGQQAEIGCSTKYPSPPLSSPTWRIVESPFAASNQNAHILITELFESTAPSNFHLDVRRVPNSQCQVQELGSAEDAERIRTVKLIAKLDAKSDSESSMFETPGAALLWMIRLSNFWGAAWGVLKNDKYYVNSF